MKILFVFTGGTIGSTSDGEKISVDSKKPNTLIEAFDEKYKIDFEYDIVNPYTVLSENSTGKTLKILCQSVSSYLKEGYDGIIVTHGTDTLQYSSAALSYALGKGSIPVCVVSSNFVIEDERSNGIDNLYGAISFIKRGKERGVWVPYKNTGDVLRIHRASRLLASHAFSDSVYSVNDSYYGYFDDDMNFIENTEYSEKEDEQEVLSLGEITEQCSSVLKLETYVGMTYPEIGSEVKYILLSSYHSGTVNTSSQSAIDFYKRAKKNGVEVFITGVSNGISYESTSSFNELNITPLLNIAPIIAYVKLWLLADKDIDIKEAMAKSLGGDIF